MFNLALDLTELEKQSDELRLSMDQKVAELERKMPQLKVNEYLQELEEEFTERRFSPLGDVWERGLRDLFDNLED